MESVRRQHRNDTTRALAGAARQCFRAKGFEATTVEEIAALAGVSGRTYFRYFPTKEAPVFVDRERLLSGFADLLAKNLETMPPFEAVTSALLTLARDVKDQRSAMFADQELIDASPSLKAAELQLDNRWEQSIEAAFLGSAGEDKRARQRAIIQAGALFGVLRVAFRLWLRNPEDLDLVSLGEEAFEMLDTFRTKG